ncbi:MAG: hypothetical protein Q4F13_10950 [Pseudomonadota bacterium]|nr:hypothetical protein [Pseudomonadota bacterium]
MNTFFAIAVAAGGVFAHADALAQAMGEQAETGPAAPDSPVPATALRSSLWQAVDAHRRQPRDASPPTDRRLTPEQRKLLREQVRAQQRERAQARAPHPGLPMQAPPAQATGDMNAH